MAARTGTKTHKILVRLTSEQRRLVEQRAERCGLAMAVWARSILIQAATRSATDGCLRLKEPDGTLI